MGARWAGSGTFLVLGQIPVTMCKLVFLSAVYNFAKKGMVSGRKAERMSSPCRGVLSALRREDAKGKAAKPLCALYILSPLQHSQTFYLLRSVSRGVWTLLRKKSPPSALPKSQPGAEMWVQVVG